MAVIHGSNSTGYEGMAPGGLTTPNAFLSASGARNTLMIVRGRHIADQIVPNLAYNMPHQLSNVIADNAANVNMAPEQMAKRACASTHAIDAITLNGQAPTHMRMGQFEHCATFVLVVDEVVNNRLIVSQRKRTMYTGIFYDEPVANWAADVPTINPNARMYILHHTVLSVTQDSGAAYGANTCVTALDADLMNQQVLADAVNGQLMSTGHSGPTYQQQVPDYLISTSDLAGSSVMMVTGGPGVGESLVDPRTGRAPEQIHTSAYDPMRNLQALTTGMCLTMSNIHGEQHRYGGAAAYMPHAMDDVSTQLVSALTPLYRPVSSVFASNNSLTNQQHISLGEVMTRYTPVTQAVDAAKYMLTGARDQTLNSKTALAARMFATIIPLLVSSFRMVSVAGTMEFSTMMGQHMPTQQFMFAQTSPGMQNPNQPAYPMGQSELMETMNHLRLAIINQVGTLIHRMYGDFNVSFSCNLLDLTSVQMNVRSDGFIIKEPLIVPTMLGGINSPAIGSTAATLTNAANLQTFICDTMGISDTMDHTIAPPNQTGYGSLTGYEASAPVQHGLQPLVGGIQSPGLRSAGATGYE